MHVGCIAMIDALGFKGIWNRHPADHVLEAMRSVREALSTTSDTVTKLMGESLAGKLTHAPRATARFLSDTIVIAIHAPSFSGQNAATINLVQAALTRHTIFATGFVVAGAAHPSRPVQLNYRGAISWGHFLVEENVLIGPAVDEVADLHARTDGPFVEIADPALKRALYTGGQTMPAHLDPTKLVFEHDVPIKPDGHRERLWVLNPFAVCPNLSEVNLVAQGIDAAFGEAGRRDHAAKYASARALLEAARRQWVVTHAPPPKTQTDKNRERRKRQHRP